MKQPRVLSVGNCDADHRTISRLLQRHYGAEVEPVRDGEGAVTKLRESSYDLVLVNRVLDADGSEGLDVIRTIKADSALASIPVMLVTNHAEFQQQAASAGAVPGFGKNMIGSPDVFELLKPWLAAT